MNPVKLVLPAAFACGFVALAASAASAMPVANVGIVNAPLTEDVHAVRMCNRGRCWWSYAGHAHGRYGYRAPYYGYRYGWRHPRYGYRYGWRRPHYGYGWRGHGGWHGGHGHWR